MLIPILVFSPMALALVCYGIGRRSKAARDAAVGAVGIAVFAGCVWLALKGGACTLPGVCGLGMHFAADGFRGLYACVAAFMWMMTGLFSPAYFRHHHDRNRYYFFNLITLGATLGVFLSDDLYTTLIFFEIMSFTSYTWVAQEETPGALRAAQTYIAVAVIGGLTTLMGLFLLYRELGTLSFTGMKAALASGQGDPAVITPAAWLTLTGFAAKAGMFPLHIWLPKAHPVAPAPASALLSGILTKSGVFGAIVVCADLMPGDAGFGNALLALAVITMFAGAVLALLSVDLKRTLACSSMSQIGFIAVGLSLTVLLGHEGSLAAYGALCHMVNHSLIKLVLFLCAGAVYMNLHQLNLNDIRGFGRKKPVLHIAFLLGALSIGCVPPLGSGYASKSLLHEALLEYIAEVRHLGGPWQLYKGIEILFLISGGLTVAYMTKLYICLFWQKHPTRQQEFDGMKGTLPGVSGAVLLLSALVLPLLGLWPAGTLQRAAARSMGFFGQEVIAHPIAFFSGENLIGAAESIGIGALVYLLIARPLLTREEGGVRVYVNRLPAWLDLERLYRAILTWLPRLLGAVTGWIADLPGSALVTRVIPGAVSAVVGFMARLPESFAVLRLIPGIITAPVRLLAELPDRLALLLRRTLLRWSKPRRGSPAASRLAAALSDTVDDVVGTVSYALLLLAFGLLVTLIYLLVA